MTFSNQLSNNILKEGSLLWKFANMNGFSVVERLWSVDEKYDSFKLEFKLSNELALSATLFGCKDELRPVSTYVNVSFQLDHNDDINDLSNDRIFDLIADIVENKNLNIYIGKHLVWKNNVSREEMLVKMDLWEASAEKQLEMN